MWMIFLGILGDMVAKTKSLGRTTLHAWSLHELERGGCEGDYVDHRRFLRSRPGNMDLAAPTQPNPLKSTEGVKGL